jgi:mannose-6-phosphate isomerase-like protein (cupin superfamily)
METIRRVSKPWGFEIWWAVTEQYAGKLLYVEHGHRLSLQYHRHKDESCYVLSGRVRLTKGPSVDDLFTAEKRSGDAWRNRPGEIHTLEALETSRVLEVSTPQLDDVVRLLDDYGRVGDAADTEPDVVAHRETDPPLRLLDRDLVAAKLQLRRDQVIAVVSDPSFPAPAGYFRGRMLWEEVAVEEWQTPAAEQLRTASF